MKTISPLDYVVVITAPPLYPGYIATHFSEADDAIGFERNADSVQTTVGMDGKMGACVSADQSGTCTLKFQQTSPANKVLNNLHDLQEGGPRTAIPMTISFQDLTRLDSVEAITGVIKKLPAINRGNKVQEQVWQIVCQKMPVTLGDPIFTGATALAEAT
jgi:hypothetical protein